MTCFSKGADRIELCDNLAQGGTTPSYGTIKMCHSLAESLNKAVVVMIRPRGGNFQYSEQELDIMKEDIEVCRLIGISEIVTGVLTETNKIDVIAMNDLIRHASPMTVVFHMAFDEIIDYDEGMRQLISMGVKRLLTKGAHGVKTALEGQ